MAEDLSSNLSSYQIQLQQVEAALTNEPDNGELLKLKKDLQEVIQLTTELIAANTEKNASSLGSEGSSKESDSSPDVWKMGHLCLAPWSEDGQYYEAIISDITEDGQCTVNFTAYGNVDVCDIEQLRAVGKDSSQLAEGSKSRKQLLQAQKDYKKKKAQKKAQRMKQLEEEREKEKMKWHSFNAKAFNKKGHVKKSIFASPDNINGRVGIGTCGIGGRPMTEFQQQEKWRRGPAGSGILGNIKAGAVLKGPHPAR